MRGRWPVYWQGQLVGHMTEKYAEMFHVYGPWETEAGPALDEFLSRLAAGEEVEIAVGEGDLADRGTVEGDAEGGLEITVRFPPEPGSAPRISALSALWRWLRR